MRAHGPVAIRDPSAATLEPTRSGLAAPGDPNSHPSDPQLFPTAPDRRPGAAPAPMRVDHLAAIVTADRLTSSIALALKEGMAPCSRITGAGESQCWLLWRREEVMAPWMTCAIFAVSTIRLDS